MPAGRAHDFVRFLLAAALVLAAAAAQAQQADFPELIWKVDDRLADVQRVFPSPVDTRVVYAAAADGLWRTVDGGAEWKLIPDTGPAKLGAISGLAVCPIRPEFVVLASREKGVFLSNDGGLSWQGAGGVNAGLASLKVSAVFFDRGDRAWKTIVAVHGADSPGLSKSADGGRRWRLMAPARYFRSVSGPGQILLASSATTDEPQNWQLVRSVNYGESWSVVAPDVAPSAGAWSLLPPWQCVWAVRDGRAVYTENEGADWKPGTFAPEGRWLGAFSTPGRTPLETWYWIYDPFQNGLYVGRGFTAAWKPRNRGLFVNRMIRQGAEVSADAAGTRFFAAINGSLYVGEHVAGEAPIIRAVWADPPVLDLSRRVDEADARASVVEASKRIVAGGAVNPEIKVLAAAGREIKRSADGRSFRVFVRVEHPKGPGEVRSVSVFPDLLGVDEVKLYDDGRHGDGAAGDGVWGGTIRFEGDRVWNAKRAHDAGRLPFPGTRTVPVVAIDASGQRATWAMPLTIHFAPDPLWIWYDPGKYWQSIQGEPRCTGPAKLMPKQGSGNGGGWALECVAGAGDWEAIWAVNPNSGSDANATGLDYVIFDFKGEPGSGDVEFAILDHLAAVTRYGREAVEAPTPSRGVSLLKEKLLPAMDGKYHTVKVPMETLIHDVRFYRPHLAGFALRSVGGAAGTYHVGEVRFANE